MALPEMQWEGKISPQFFVSLLNFLAIAFVGGMIWQSTTGGIADNTKQIDELKAQYLKAVERLDSEISRLRLQDTSIAVLKTDVTYIKESIGRIEAAIQRTR